MSGKAYVLFVFCIKKLYSFILCRLRDKREEKRKTERVDRKIRMEYLVALEQTRRKGEKKEENKGKR